MHEVQVLREAWIGPYEMVCSVKVGGVVETVSVRAEPVYGSAEAFFKFDSAFSSDERDGVEFALIYRYWGLDLD